MQPALHKLPRKSSLNVSFVLYCTVLSCPDHGDYDDHGDQEEVGGCTQGSWRLSDQMRASIALNDESSVTHLVLYVGIKLLWQLKRIGVDLSNLDHLVRSALP